MTGRVLSIRSSFLQRCCIDLPEARCPMPRSASDGLVPSHARMGVAMRHESWLCSALYIIVTASRVQRMQANAPKLPYEPQFLHKIFTLGLVQQGCVEKRPERRLALDSHQDLEKLR
uniref:GTG start codon; ORFA n=1 Tax=Bradyrhizobium japonicum TaxID=375 RepID=Q45270_BRAJP|nr:GTG start codon; ORFA [Bradyrhizobium diazoefficiens USDA 110]